MTNTNNQVMPKSNCMSSQGSPKGHIERHYIKYCACFFRTIRVGCWSLSLWLSIHLSSQNLIWLPSFNWKDPKFRNASLTFMRPTQKLESLGFLSTWAIVPQNPPGRPSFLPHLASGTSHFTIWVKPDTIVLLISPQAGSNDPSYHLLLATVGTVLDSPLESKSWGLDKIGAINPLFWYYLWNKQLMS